MSVNNTNSYPLSGLVFNILAALYFTIWAPEISKISLAVFTGENIYYPIFGTGLLILVILEGYAAPQKMKLVIKRVSVMEQSGTEYLFMLWFMHILITGVLVLSIFLAFGISMKDVNGNYSLWIMFTMMILFVKELFSLFPLLADNPIDKKKYKKLKKQEWFYDAILIFFSWFAFTVLWTMTTKIGDTDMHKENIGLYILNLMVTSLLFLIAYLPLRIPYLYEEISYIKNHGERFRFYFTLFIVLVSVIGRL